eukprot:TRINITY_DN146_c1_g1_i1.p1 TRINITY_DN146_c1_g1~~TRINITY_DN146_c1_g1_i1.p1  ORF type:complete len:683 (-),score=185.91 TRINITY_DN146_c1_g1_i1:169-2055(-)
MEDSSSSSSQSVELDDRTTADIYNDLSGAPALDADVADEDAFYFEANTPLRKFGKYVLTNKGLIIGLLFFIIFCGVRVNPSDPRNVEQSLCIGITLLMIVWWFSNTLPIAITALIPIALFPMAGILSTAKVTAQYSNNIIFLLAGSFVVALAIEKWNLHKRLVYLILLKVGTSKKKILAGFMIVSAVLSAWMSNVTVALIMLPVVNTLAQNIQKSKRLGISTERLERAYLLAIAWACSVGGTFTPIGSPANLVTIRLLRSLFPTSPEISFLQWMGFTVPLGVLFLVIAYLYLAWRYFSLFGHVRKVDDSPTQVSSEQYALFDKDDDAAGDDDDQSDVDAKLLFQTKLKALGPMTIQEKIILADFILLIILWVFRADFVGGADHDCTTAYNCLPGWHHLFTHRLSFASSEAQGIYLEDSAITILLILPLFIIPDGKGKKLMTWEKTVTLPWNVLWLVGGGFALAEGIEETGLAQFLASQLSGLAGAAPALVLFVLLILVLIVANVATNIAIAAIIVPIFGAFAAQVFINPFFLVIPAAVATSYAFMMPTSSPINAIVFTSKKFDVKKMAKHGSVMTLLALALVWVSWCAYGQFVYKASSFEAWGNNTLLLDPPVDPSASPIPGASPPPV